MGYIIKISCYVPRTEYMCSWEPHRFGNCQNYLSLEAKPKCTVVEISLVTTSGCLIMCVSAPINAKTWAHAVYMHGSTDWPVASSSPGVEKGTQGIFLTCKFLQLWTPFKPGRFEEEEEETCVKWKLVQVNQNISFGLPPLSFKNNCCAN